MRLDQMLQTAIRAVVMTAACVVVALATTACPSVAPHADADFPEPANEFVRKDIERRVSEIRFMHDTELLQNLERLAAYADMAVPAVRRGLEDDDWLTRVGCLWVVSRLGDKRNIAYVAPLLDDSKPEVRYEAAATLVELGDATGFPTLVGGLEDPDLRIRYKCRSELIRHVNTDFGFAHDGPVAERQEAVHKWRGWLVENDMQPR